jgi:hypothetical protein
MKKIKTTHAVPSFYVEQLKKFQNTSLLTLPLEEQRKAMDALNKAEKVCCIFFT